MRILMIVPALLLGACNVSTDANNDAMTVQYNEQAAQNAAADVTNTAQDVGNAISNGVNEAGNEVNDSGIVANDNDSNAVDNRQ
jgi:hypothetical protein